MKIITASLLESYGAFLPFYKVGTWRGSKLQIREKPLLTRYVLVNLPENAARWCPGYPSRSILERVCMIPVDDVGSS